MVLKRDRKALGEYCRRVADLLELRDWTINVSVGEIESPNHPAGWQWWATSESTPGRKRVQLRFAEDVRDWAIEDLRSTVAHELIHAHFAPLMEMLRVDLRPHLKHQAYELFNESATRHLEFGVDAMADATARHLPLIAWPAKPARRSSSARS